MKYCCDLFVIQYYYILLGKYGTIRARVHDLIERIGIIKKEELFTHEMIVIEPRLKTDPASRNEFELERRTDGRTDGMGSKLFDARKIARFWLTDGHYGQ